MLDGFDEAADHEEEPNGRQLERAHVADARPEGDRRAARERPDRCAQARRRRAIQATIGVAAALAPASASAYRPFDGTDSAVADVHTFEIELGPVGYLRDGSVPSLVAPALVVNFGLFNGFELVAEGKDIVAFPAGGPVHSYFDDVAFSVKYVLRDGVLQAHPGPSIAAELAALVPTLSGETAGLSLAVIGSERWPAATVHLNTLGALDRDRRFEAFASLIVEGPAAWAARPVAEVFVDEHVGLPATVSGLVGVIWPARKDLVFDAATRIADGGHLAGEVRLGLTWTFPKARSGGSAPAGAFDPIAFRR